MKDVRFSLLQAKEGIVMLVYMYVHVPLDINWDIQCIHVHAYGHETVRFKKKIEAVVNCYITLVTTVCSWLQFQLVDKLVFDVTLAETASITDIVTAD